MPLVLYNSLQVFTNYYLQDELLPLFGSPHFSLNIVQVVQSMKTDYVCDVSTIRYVVYGN